MVPQIGGKNHSSAGSANVLWGYTLIRRIFLRNYYVILRHINDLEIDLVIDLVIYWLSLAP